MISQLFDISNYYLNPFGIPILLVSIFIFFAGFFVLHQNRKSIINVAFCYECLSISLWLFAMGLVYFSSSMQVALTWYKHFTFLGVLNIMPSLVFFSLALLGQLKVRMKWIVANYFIVFGFYLFAIFSDKMVAPVMREYYWGFYPIYGSLALVFFIHFSIQALIGYGGLFIAYRREKNLTRKKQIGVIAIANIIGFTAAGDFVAKMIDVSLYPYGFISLFVFIFLVGYSIIRYRAFDIETVLHKTALWLLSFSFVLVPIFFIFRRLAPILDSSISLEFSFWIVSFLAFTLYLRLVQPKIDHFFQRHKSNLDEISTRFTEDLVHLKGLTQLVNHIEETISQSLYPQRVDIYIYDQANKKYHLESKNSKDGAIKELDGDNDFLDWLSTNSMIAYKDFIDIDPNYVKVRQRAKRYFELTEAAVVVPLALNENLLGAINLGKKSSLKRYKAVDLGFLSTLKNQSVIAISNSLLYEDMEKQVRDKTEALVEVQEQLVQAAKLATMGTLAGGVAHEINNPLAAILTNVQMLLMDGKPEEDEDLKESLELIEDATKRCRTIVQKLMTYARKPKESVEFAEVDVADVIQKVITFLNYQLKQEDVELSVDVEPDISKISGNQNELQQVITNVVLNAKDAIKRDKSRGIIKLVVVNEAGLVRIDIEDQGRGMSEDVISKMFDPFFTTKDVGNGLGLGLSICHSIIEKHKGTIIAQSEVGKGTIITIKLPKVLKTEEIENNRVL